MEIFTNTPLISVYISTYNRVEKLKRAINSVLEQDFTNFEILVCDDASTDETESYVTSLINDDKRIRYFRNKKNKGACAARNLGIFSAKGKYITGLDDDDEFTCDRLSCFLKYWDDQYSFICANFFEAYPHGDMIPFYEDSGRDVKFSYKKILFKNVASNQIFTLTNRLQKIGGFNVSVKRFQDWDTWLRLSYDFGGFLRIAQCNYIMHHDHSPGEARVSKNAPVGESLIALLDRNKDMYTRIESLYMKSLASHMNRGSGFFEMIRWRFIRLAYYLFI